MARGTLVKITETLGVRYLQYLLKEMQSILVKGYQVQAETPSPLLFLAVRGNPQQPRCLAPGPRVDVHSLPVTVGPQTSAEER